MVPLVIQLALIGRFIHLYSESERALASSDRYGEVTQTLIELDAHMFRLVQTFYGFKLNINNARSTHNIITSVTKDLDGPITKLRALSKDDPDSISILNKLEEIRNSQSIVLEKLANQTLQGIGDMDKALLIRQFASLMHSASVAIPELEDSIQKLAFKKREQAKLLKQEERTMIAVFAFIDFGFAGLAMAALLRSTNLKLRKLRRNVDNLALERPLSEPSAGGDEIDVIDRAFYETASKLRVLHRKERALIYESQDPIIFLNLNCEIIFTNQAAAEVVRERENFLDYADGDTKDALASFLKSVREGRQKNNLEIELQFDGRRRVILSAVLEPEENALLCIIHDITERHEIETIRQEIVSMFTHDLRNPLTSLTLALESLAAKPELLAYNKIMTRAQNNVTRMSQLINDLLDLYKTEAGLMKFEKSRFLLSDVCQSAVQEVIDAASHLNVEVKTNLSDDIAIEADYKSLLRILVNLLSNAIKYSPPGSTVKLVVGPLENNVAFQVVDNGPGIPEEEQPLVFNRFQQVSTAKNSRISQLGSGLGLAICKAFAERQGGRMVLSSKVGVGSAFTCILPKK